MTHQLTAPCLTVVQERQERGVQQNQMSFKGLVGSKTESHGLSILRVGACLSILLGHCLYWIGHSSKDVEVCSLTESKKGFALAR